VCVCVCVSRGSSQLRCAKTAEQIKMLFGVNTVGVSGTLCLHGGPDPPTDREKGPTFKFWDTPRISGTAKSRDLKFCMRLEGDGP